MFLDKGQVARNFKYRVNEVFEMILLSKPLTFFSRWNCFRLASHGTNISKRILFKRTCSKSDSMFLFFDSSDGSAETVLQLVTLKCFYQQIILSDQLGDIFLLLQVDCM